MIDETLYHYPKTRHFSYSDGLQNDDRRLEDESVFEGMTVAVEEKLDGESASLYPNHYHPRSTMGGNHQSRDWIKKYHAEFKHKIPIGWRICMENMFSKHAIFYSDLETYAYVLNIWNENNECLSLADTLYVCKDLGLIHAPIIAIMKYNAKQTEEIFHRVVELGKEGIVVRNINSFHYKDFSKNVGKCVRKGHVQYGSEHWSKDWIPNKLREDLR